jgi:hypothetical protein
LRVVVAAGLAVAANAVLVAQHLLKLGAHLVTALARLHVHKLTRRSSLEAGRKRGRKGGEERRNARNSVWQFGTGNRKCRWRARVYPERKIKRFYHSNLSSFGAVQSTLGVGGRGREIFASAKCQLQFAKASAATLPQQEKNDTADVQRGRVNISGFIGTVAS